MQTCRLRKRISVHERVHWISTLRTSTSTNCEPLHTNFVPTVHADETQPSPAQETCVSFVFLLPCFPHPGLSKCGTSGKNRESKYRIICWPWLRANEAAVGGQESHAKRCCAEGGGSMTATQHRQVAALKEGNLVESLIKPCP